MIGPLSNHKDMLVTDCMTVLVMKRALSERSLVAMALLEKSGYVMSCSQLIQEVNTLVFPIPIAKLSNNLNQFFNKQTFSGQVMNFMLMLFR